MLRNQEDDALVGAAKVVTDAVNDSMHLLRMRLRIVALELMDCRPQSPRVEALKHNTHGLNYKIALNDLRCTSIRRKRHYLFIFCFTARCIESSYQSHDACASLSCIAAFEFDFEVGQGAFAADGPVAVERGRQRQHRGSRGHRQRGAPQRRAHAHEQARPRCQETWRCPISRR